jgi:hypothetical protein
MLARMAPAAAKSRFATAGSIFETLAAAQKFGIDCADLVEHLL